MTPMPSTALSRVSLHSSLYMACLDKGVRGEEDPKRTFGSHASEGVEEVVSFCKGYKVDILDLGHFAEDNQGLGRGHRVGQVKFALSDAAQALRQSLKYPNVVKKLGASGFRQKLDVERV